MQRLYSPQTALLAAAWDLCQTALKTTGQDMGPDPAELRILRRRASSIKLASKNFHLYLSSLSSLGTMFLIMWDENGRLRMDLSKPDVDAWLEQQQNRIDKVLLQQQEVVARDVERRARWEELLWRRWNRERRVAFTRPPFTTWPEAAEPR